MIQVIKYKDYPKLEIKNCVIHSFSNFESFDLYDLNIISLNDSDIWCSNSSEIGNLNCSNDLCKLKKSINSSGSKTIVLLPSNCSYKYYYRSYNNSYEKHIDIKNILIEIKEILSRLIYDSFPAFEYEKGKCIIDDITFNSDFYFENYDGGNILLKSEKSNKIIAIEFGNVIVCATLIDFNKECESSLNILLSKLLKSQAEKEPDWINNIKFYNDDEYYKKNELIQSKIKKLNLEISENNKILDKNKYYKSILYKTGNELQKVIIEMLEAIIGKHSDFEDLYEEDYLFKENDCSFIVETKGLNKEVNGKHITDAFSHMVIYEDNLEKVGNIEKTKCLFFVTYDRFKPISERSKINERQIIIAKRNNVLIIDSVTFLYIFEDYLNKKISKEEILYIFENQSGLVEYSKR